MPPEIPQSARKHGVADARILHAYEHPIRVFESEGLTMLIGADQAGRLLEVGVARAVEIDYIVHAMVARRAFLR